MKRNYLMLGGIVAAVLVAGVAFAQRGGYGPGPGMGYGPGSHMTGTNGNINVENLKKFQKETQALRDEMMVKRAELNNEYNKETPDAARMTELRKEIIDLQAKIRKSAETYGLNAGGPGPGAGRGYGRGMYGGGCGRW
jgi:hypothetical protein